MRLHARSFAVLRMPTLVRKMRTIGNSNVSPNANATSMTNVRNSPPVSSGTNGPPANPRRNCRAFGSVR